MFCEEKQLVVGKILRQLFDWKRVEIIEAEACKGHVDILVEMRPNM